MHHTHEQSTTTPGSRIVLKKPYKGQSALRTGLQSALAEKD